jgi:hypothetical protein
MNKRQILKEALKGHIKEAISKGNIKEGWIENFIDDIFDGAREKMLKNDPSIKRLSKEMNAAMKKMYDNSIKTYGSTDKFPEYIVRWFEEAGYKI